VEPISASQRTLTPRLCIPMGANSIGSTIGQESIEK